MRRKSCVGLVGALVLLATSSVGAQHHVWPAGDECGCHACAQTTMTAHCCSEPLIPALLRGIHNTLGCLICCPGLNARHDIYRAALNRNDFDKCGSPLLPIYMRKRCCGPVAAGCPQCGHAYSAEGEVIESSEMPDEMYLEPTPAAEYELSPTPQEATPGPEARRRPSSAPRAATPNFTNRPSVPRDRAARAVTTDSAPRPATAAGTARRTQSAAQVQRTGLLDAPRR